ncbi:MAG: ThiF family adenylyltransferase [Patescibacteria group bacterium]
MLEIIKPKIIDQSEFEKISKSNSITFVDAYKTQIEEIFQINNPQIKKTSVEYNQKLGDFLLTQSIQSILIYYSYYNTVVKSVNEDYYYILRTSRNKDIISHEDQIKYRNSKIGIAGLSVGSAVVAALTITGGPKNIKISDFDTVETTNLNRIRAKLIDIGKIKTEITAREVWDIDPFAELELWSNGLSNENMLEFITQPKLDIFIDEFEDIGLKIKSRIICRENRIPVLMATDNGDNVLLDVERFDIEMNRPIFHGLIEESEFKDLQKIDFKTWLRLATKIVGPEYLPLNMQKSILNIGKTIPSVPQLGSTAMTAGGAIVYAARKIICNSNMPSGRYVINLEEILNPDYNSDRNIESRKKSTEDFKNKFL